MTMHLTLWLHSKSMKVFLKSKLTINFNLNKSQEKLANETLEKSSTLLKMTVIRSK